MNGNSQGTAHEAAKPPEACDCCEGLTRQTPAVIHNRPGLSAIAYRIGTHSQFKQTMLSRLSAKEFGALRQLQTRENSDFAIALLDAWATVSDVLTFYQERIANEAYLRTATERRSVLELARLIGYHLRPGVAAETYLAFTVDESQPETQRTPVELATGTQVESIPYPGQQAQTFETAMPITARADWNKLRPRLMRSQPLSNSTKEITLQGLINHVQVGDFLLIVTGTRRAKRTARKITAVVQDNKAQTTTVTLQTPASHQAAISQPTIYAKGVFFTLQLPLSNRTVVQNLIGRRWKQADLLALTTMQKWSKRKLVKHLKKKAVSTSTPEQNSSSPSLFSFHQRAAIFGHNAPKWQSLSAGQRFPQTQTTATGSTTTSQPAYADNWENRTLKAEASSTTGTSRIDLEAAYPKIAAGSFLLLQSDRTVESYRVTDTTTLSRSDFTLSSKLSRIQLEDSSKFDQFTLRETTVFAQSERLVLASIPITTPVEGTTLTLDQPDLDLQVGQAIALSGERLDLAGVTDDEIAIIAEVTLNGGLTVLTFEQALRYRYRRHTLTINANVVLATHGETKTEVLGSGSGDQVFQSFTLKRSPLTYLSSATASGATSTLEIWVNSIRWQAVNELNPYGAEDQVYVTRLNDDGTTTVQFGDGITGARLPTGTENIRAIYRHGIGEAGLVAPSQLSLLKTRPAGIRSVTNPLAPINAENPERLTQARRHAPLTVLTLDRIVSLQDYEDFTHAFSGIAKALATWTWNGQQKGVFITIAGPQGAAVAPQSTLYENLLSAIRQAGDPSVALKVLSYRAAFFQVEGTVKLQPNVDSAVVLPHLKQKLRHHFSFKNRRFGQSVFLSEVISLIQSVAGVVAVDIDASFRTDAASINILSTDAAGTNTLSAGAATASNKPFFGHTELTAHISDPGIAQPLPAELLTLDPRPIRLRLLS